MVGAKIGVNEKYHRTIDTLTIFAHAAPADIAMSDAFHIQNNDNTKYYIDQLRSKNILSANAKILLLHVMQDRLRKARHLFRIWRTGLVRLSTQTPKIPAMLRLIKGRE